MKVVKNPTNKHCLISYNKHTGGKKNKYHKGTTLVAYNKHHKQHRSFLTVDSKWEECVGPTENKHISTSRYTPGGRIIPPESEIHTLLFGLTSPCTFSKPDYPLHMYPETLSSLWGIAYTKNTIRYALSNDVNRRKYSSYYIISRTQHF